MEGKNTIPASFAQSGAYHSHLNLQKFLNSPLRDTATWGRNVSQNAKSLQNTISLYESVIEGEICIFLGDIHNGKRNIVFGDRPGIVLGDVIQQVLDEPNFIWIEKLPVDATSDTLYFALVMVSNGEVVVDQVAPLLDILLIDYVKVFVLPQSARIYVRQGPQGLNEAEIGQFVRALGRSQSEITLLPNSLFDSIDMASEELPRALPVEEVFVQHGLILVRTPFGLLGLGALVIAVVGYLLRNEIQELLRGEEQAFVGVTISDFVIPTAMGFPATLVIDRAFMEIGKIYGVDWWLPNKLTWTSIEPTRVELGFAVGGLFADRVPPALAELNMEIVTVPPSDAAEQTVDALAVSIIDLEPSEVKSNNFEFYSTDPLVQRDWTNLKELTVKERLREILYYFGVEPTDFTINQSEQTGMLISDYVVERFVLEVQWRNVDVETIRAFIIMLSAEPVTMDSFDLQISEVGLMTGLTRFLVYEAAES